jgi:hypothetical protein
MDYPGTNQARLAHLEPTHTSSERSAFVYAVEHCNHFMLEPSEIKALTPQPYSMRVPIFHMGSDACGHLGQALGIDSRTWARSIGRDIVGVQPVKSILLGELRYCLECLKQGWHSALFQHVAIERCPLHRLRLQTGCHHCGSQIQTSMHAIGRNHFHCGECGRSLASERRRTGMGKPVVQISAASFAPLRNSLLDTGASDLIRSPLSLGQYSELVLAEACTVRGLRHHLMWGEPGNLDEQFSPKSTEACLSVSQQESLISSSQFQRRLRASALTAIEELVAMSQRVGASVDIPAEVTGIGEAAARIDVSISLVAAALWRTAHLLDVSHFILGELPPPQAKEQPLAQGIPSYEEVADMIRRAQVFGLFVDSMMQLRLCQYGVEIDWNGTAKHLSLLPAWRGGICAGRVEVRLRTRCDASRISRLVRRYAGKSLANAPDGVSMQELAVAGP